MAAVAEIYLDETGTHANSPVLGVAGYVFMRSKAKKFTSAWKVHLAAQGIPFFHMADCAPSPGNAHYRGWSAERRDKHERALIKLIKETASFGFSQCCSLKAINDLSDLELPSKYDAYTLMLALGVNAACDYLRSKDFDGRASFFFEAGHQYQRQAKELLHRLANRFPSQYFHPNFRFVHKTEAPPIQAADLLAWLSRNALIKTLADKPVRRDFLALAEGNHQIKYYDEQTLKSGFDVYAGRSPDPNVGLYPMPFRRPD